MSMDLLKAAIQNRSPITFEYSCSDTGHPVFRKFLRLAGAFSD